MLRSPRETKDRGVDRAVVCAVTLRPDERLGGELEGELVEDGLIGANVGGVERAEHDATGARFGHAEARLVSQAAAMGDNKALASR